MDSNKEHYSPKEIALILDISDSNLRKWCLAIEEAGYLFSRTDNNRRVFFERDKVALKQFRELVQVQNLSLQNAAILVAGRLKEDASGLPHGENAVTEVRSDNAVLVNVISEIEQLKELNRQLLKRLDEQDKYIEERLNKRDELLMESLRESQETKQLLLAAKEEEEKKPRRGVFSRLFGK